ncbi:MAG: serine/threonine protein kinase [Pseudomonadota bacterium]
MAVPSAPIRIGNYSIVEQIGVGESSNVYLAIEEDKFFSVAIKQLRMTRQSEPYLKLLANEVELAGKLHHKNIARVLSAKLEEKNGPYVVMEYVKGVSLDHHQNAETLLPINTVLSVIEQIAGALQYIAGQGVIHRDVKPENILLMPNGMAKLTDFGCAIPLGTSGDMVAGSLAYMSPEQLEGLPLDERADIYSLAATLYRLLTGKNTFEADNEFDARIAVLNFPAVPIQTYRKELPQELVRVTHRGLEKDLRNRYPDWPAFISDLGNAAHKIHMSDYDMDLYRGFSMSTQSVLSRLMTTDHEFSRSGFSRSTMAD